MSRFLRFVVEQSFNGSKGDLKEYSVGLAVFDRPASFDPQTDSVVRGGARRLRGMLLDYYAGQGRLDPIRIELPKGTYAPVFNAGISPAAQHPALSMPTDRISEGAPPVADGGHARKSRQLAHWLVGTVVAGALGFGSLYVVSKHVTTPELMRPVPLTTFRGLEANPALSPDGNYVAFVWNGEGQDNFDIYVKSISSGVLQRLTRDSAAEDSPAWSPDGRTIAFIRRRRSDGIGELRLIPASGGPEHRVHEIRNLELRHLPSRLLSLSWSPDGKWIAASHREPADLAEGIYLFSRTGEKRRLTSAISYAGDQMPALSPDGRSLAFSRHSGASSGEIYLLPLNSTSQPAGETRRISPAKGWSVNPAWTPDGKGLLYLSIGDSGGHGELRKIDISSRQLTERTVLLNDEPREISIGRHLVYSRRSADMNIWRATIPPPGSAPTEPELFITSTRTDIKPEYSPDGKKIAFNSDRSGSREIWIANADGSNQVQVTFFGGPLVGVTTWSPDGQWLLFHARPEGQADLFVIPAAGGSPRRLTTHSADDTLSSYSRDGRWIYFSSARSGTIQIWKMPAEGGEPVKITTRRGSAPFESFDGKTIFYRPQDLSEIWGIPSNGGQAVKVTGPIQRYPVGYAVTADGIYYPAPPHSGEQGFIMFFSFATGRSIPIVVASQRLGLGMSVSPDGHYILFDQADESNSDLMLVQNFQVR